MGKQLSLLFALVLASGCAASHEGLCDERLHATVTIEETGEVLAVQRVFPARSLSGTRDSLFIQMEGGQELFVDFPRPAPTGGALRLAAPIPTPDHAWVDFNRAGGSDLPSYVDERGRAHPGLRPRWAGVRRLRDRLAARALCRLRCGGLRQAGFGDDVLGRARSSLKLVEGHTKRGA
jgi:hypothetical protein